MENPRASSIATPSTGSSKWAMCTKPGHSNTPHDHGPCWVVYGAFSGLTEITKYKRTDDGSQPGKATLEKDELHRLSPRHGQTLSAAAKFIQPMPSKDLAWSFVF